MYPPVILPPVIDDIPSPGVAIAVELDKLLLVQLRDGRKIMGILRSFDQFSNLMLECAWGIWGGKPCAALVKRVQI